MREHADTRAAKVFEGMGIYSPTLGIIGAVLGLMAVMQNLADPSQARPRHRRGVHRDGVRHRARQPVLPAGRRQAQGHRRRADPGARDGDRRHGRPSCWARTRAPSSRSSMATCTEMGPVPMAWRQITMARTRRARQPRGVGDPVRRPDHAAARVLRGDVRDLVGQRGQVSACSPIRWTRRSTARRRRSSRSRSARSSRAPGPIRSITIWCSSRSSTVSARHHDRSRSRRRCTRRADPCGAERRARRRRRRGRAGDVGSDRPRARHRCAGMAPGSRSRSRTDILFPSGVATLSPQAEQVLTQLAETLKPYPEPGPRRRPHRQPAHQHGAFPSNWELSAARAASVVHRVHARRAWIRRVSL